MNIVKAFVFALFFLIFPAAIQAALGTEGASFLDIPVGAGPAALGAAYTALATNAYAPVWNPAGLGKLSGTSVAGQHLSYLDSMNYEFLSFVHPFDSSPGSDVHRGVGFSVQYLGSGDINRTNIDSNGNPINNGDPIGTFSSHFASYNLSYGQTLTENLSVGLTGKLINATIDNVNANAYAADLGTLYQINDKVQAGASLDNLGTSLKFLTDGNSLPTAFKAGAAYHPNSQFLISAEGVYEKNGSGGFHTGAEWRPIQTVSVRAGYRTDTLSGLSPLAGFSTGLGLHVWGQEFAYAWTPYGDLGDTQYFSIVVRFNAAEEEGRNLIQYQAFKPRRHIGRQGEYSIKGTAADEKEEPEYQQLMQLLSTDDDAHVAETPHTDDAR